MIGTTPPLKVAPPSRRLSGGASPPAAPRARHPRNSRQAAGATRFPRRNHHAVTVLERIFPDACFVQPPYNRPMPALREILKADQRVREGDRALWENLIATASAAMPAATAARFPKDSPASARSASTAAARSTFPGATPPECNATRSRRSRFFTRIPARSPTASECWAAICTAPTARIGSLRRPCAIRMRSRRRCGRPGIAGPDALGQGAKVLVSTYNEPLITSEWAVAVFQEARRRIAHRLCLQRQRHAAGSRISASVDRPLQSRSEELRRSPLPRTRRTPSADSRHHPQLCTRWVSGWRS